MDQAINDASDSKVAQPQAETAPAESEGAAEQKTEGAIPPPGFGFDKTGQFFVVKVHLSYGATFIRGVLKDADDWFMGWLAQQRNEQEKRSIIKPNKWNRLQGLFKGK